MQRFFDILFSFISILAFFPLLLIVAIVLRFTGEGLVLYKQERIGKKSRLFQILKFATMLKNSPNIGTGTLTVKNDPRVLPVGRILRKTKINELPQLFNILRGDMSLIGPRPLTSEALKSYTSSDLAKITEVTPGLSGIGSIIFRDEETLLDKFSDPTEFYNSVIGPYKAELEKWYVDNKSLSLYFLLIFLTILAVINPQNNLPFKVIKGLPKPPAELGILVFKNNKFSKY